MELLNNKKIILPILFFLLIAENTLLILILIPLLSKSSDKHASETLLYRQVDVFRWKEVNTEDFYSTGTYITTLSEELKRDTVEYPNPFAQPAPYRIDVKKHGLIKMDIIDSNNVFVKGYKFPVHRGVYNIESWAFLKDLPHSRYKFKFELPDTLFDYLTNH